MPAQLLFTKHDPMQLGYLEFYRVDCLTCRRSILERADPIAEDFCACRVDGCPQLAQIHFAAEPYAYVEVCTDNHLIAIRAFSYHQSEVP